MKFRLFPLSEDAVIIELGKKMNQNTHRKVQLITNYLNNSPPHWMIEHVPAFTTITIYYNPLQVSKISRDTMPYQFICQEIDRFMQQIRFEPFSKSRIVEIPVCYGGEFGPDLQFVAEYNHLTKDEVIEIHSSGEYVVHMIGFAPGFAYIGGMSEKICAPRKKTPRLKIPERSVGIAGKQTGIYPLETPGGWRVIGRTPVRLFTPEKNPSTLLMAGDQIQFIPISITEYLQMENTLNVNY